MGEVVAFREKSDPHCSGPAVCLGCRHKWAAVAPVGTWLLECPSCGTLKGVYEGLCQAQPGDLAFACNCGCKALTAYKRGALFHLICMKCGVDQTEAIFEP